MAVRFLFFPKICNIVKLNGELRAALGARLDGAYDSNPAGTPGCGVALFSTATPADETTVANLVTAHDPTPLPDPMVVDLNTAKSQAGVNPLDGLTVSDALSWIDTNVTDLATARTALKQMVKILAIHERRLRIIERTLNL